MRCNILGVSNSSSCPEDTLTLSYLFVTPVIYKCIAHLLFIKLCAQGFINIVSFLSTLKGSYYYSHDTEAETEAQRTKLKHCQAL